MRERPPQPDGAQVLLALLCEQMHERLQRGGSCRARRLRDRRVLPTHCEGRRAR